MHNREDRYKKITAREALLQLETRLAEGLAAPGYSGAAVNIFGRPVVSFSPADLSALAGMAASGLRIAMILPAGKAAPGRQQLDLFVRQHLPAVLYMTIGDPDGGPLPLHRRYRRLADSGFIQLFAANAQQAVDLGLIARRITERALIPALVIIDSADAQAVELPTGEQLRQWLGSPDEPLPAPTPAQQIIFGEQRRRLPNWYNYDLPALLGPAKKSRGLAMESAAQQYYFYRHLPAITGEAFRAFGQLTGRHYGMLDTYRTEKADYLLLTQGAPSDTARVAVDRMRSEHRLRAGTVHLLARRPFPAEELSQLLSGKKGVTVLEATTERENGPLFTEVAAALQPLGKRAPQLFSGQFGAAVTVETLLAVFDNMTRRGAERRHLLLEIDFAHERSSSPQHEILLQAIRRSYPHYEEETIGAIAEEPDEATPLPTLAPPLAIRQYRDQGPPYSRLSRFYHDTASFYETGELSRLVADPFQAIPNVPAATANFGGQAAGRKQMPVFSAADCSGCGDCFTYCPHAAIPPLALGPEVLLRDAMALAAQRGAVVTQLTPVVRNLAKLAAQIIRKTETPIQTVDDFLPTAFQQLTKKMKLSGDKLEKLQTEFTELMVTIRFLPVAVTDTFFHQREQVEKGSGELFTLAVDPHACTGCGLCAQVCEPQALTMQEQTPERLQSTETAFRRWEKFSDTDPETIRRFIHNADYPSFAALLLSRNFYLSTTGGSRSEQGAPAKAAFHLIAAVAESVTQPRQVKLAERAGALIDALSALVHTSLSEALPKGNYEELFHTLREAGGRRVHLDELVGQMGAREHLRVVNTAVLERQVALLEALKALRWELTEGPSGTGRARFGLFGAGPLPAWTNEYPYNTFTGPILLDEGIDATAALGLVQGQLRHVLDQVRLLRRGRLETEGAYQPAIHDKQIARLQWEDLGQEERDLLPPLLLLTTRQWMSEQAPLRLQRLLCSTMPVKLILLDDGTLPAGSTPATSLAAAQSLLLAAAAARQAFVLQAPFDASDALFNKLLDGLRRPGPALFHLLAADHLAFDAPPQPWPHLNTLGWKARHSPFLLFDPRPKIEERIRWTLGPNPDADHDWTTTPWPGREGVLYTITYADWLVRQQAWQDHFLPAEEGDDKLVPLANYLYLPPTDRHDRRPIVLRPRSDGSIETVIASTAVVEATTAALQNWRYWRETTAAERTASPTLRRAVEQKLNAQHEAALTALRNEYEARLAKREAEIMKKAKERLRDKLVTLARDHDKTKTEP